MAAVDELLDKVKESCSLPSDMALATKMGIQRQLLSKARMGDKPLSDERIAQLCAMAKLDGGSWMARIHAERAGTPAERALWRSVLDRLSAAAAVVALVVLAVHTGAHEGLLTALSPLALTAPSIHYAKWTVLTLLCLVAVYQWLSLHR
ncbi:DUF3693 domain-containing protein, partial [Xanthomonas campestris pv. campestris]|nr:DUF3693 domain-containing protein [Xanthomonas campestris pv. campestris]MEA0642791.1 DUF3693 domain-containing protein [Xanthomonas campestris pv. campestris]